MNDEETKANIGLHTTPYHGLSHDNCARARVMPGVRLLSILILREENYVTNR